jgi:hypothetical protein
VGCKKSADTLLPQAIVNGYERCSKRSSGGQIIAMVRTAESRHEGDSTRWVEGAAARASWTPQTLRYTNDLTSAKRRNGSLGEFKTEVGYLPEAHACWLRPIAMVICKNRMALSFLAALRDRNITGSEQSSVVGFDDCDWSEYVQPSLTVIQ